MREPGLDRHDWETELHSLEDSVRADPISALSELDALVARMLEETGVDANDEARREFAAAHEITLLAESGDDISPGNVRRPSTATARSSTTSSRSACLEEGSAKQ